MTTSGLKMLRNRHSALWGDLIVGLMTGIVVFLLVNTGASLDVTNESWILNGYIEKDILQHYTGWLYYRESPLSFPLGIADQINAPDGCAVTFTDSIPLFAIFFRLISSFLPDTFQYFGIYTLLCYMLQGASAALLLRLFVKQHLLVWFGSILFCLSPIFLERSFRHTALASHYLILFALTLYFTNQKQGFRFRFSYYLLLGIATAIHPYFLPMIFAILFADLIQYAVKTKHWLTCAVFLLGSFAVVLAVGFSIGIFSQNISGDADGYGYFTMNLNALFNPSSKGMVWSAFVQPRPQALGSYDGFNYLGLGFLLTLPICIAAYLWRQRPRGCIALLRRYWGLVFVCACLTIFAVSPTIIYGGLVIVSVNLPDFLIRLCSIFRSSGRMFYPIYYLLFLFVLIQLSRIKKKPFLSTAAVLLLVLVQIADISPALAQKRAFFTESSSSQQTVLSDPLWETLPTNYSSITELGGLLNEPVSLAHYCAKNSLSNNLTWTARTNAERSQAESEFTIEQLLAGQINPDTVYITCDEVLFHQLAESLGDQVYALWVDQLWYMLLPVKDGVSPPISSDSCRIYPDFPLKITDYSDDLWTGGVFNSDPRLCAFLDNAFTQRWLDDAEYLICDGIEYPILDKNYKDEGWVMVTLDIQDATILQNRELTVR